MRRAVPLWRSDGNGDPLGEQGHTYGMAFWLPYYGSGIPVTDLYTLRSGMMPGYLVFLQLSADTDTTKKLVRRMLLEWRAVADNFLGDYYPLTPYSLDMDAWMAWQFNRPEEGSGVVQAFRRDFGNSVALMHFKLRGLDPTATYEIKNFDLSAVMHETGHTLMTTGLSVRLNPTPAAATISYKQIKHS